MGLAHAGRTDEQDVVASSKEHRNVAGRPPSFLSITDGWGVEVEVLQAPTVTAGRRSAPGWTGRNGRVDATLATRRNRSKEGGCG